MRNETRANSAEKNAVDNAGSFIATAEVDASRKTWPWAPEAGACWPACAAGRRTEEEWTASEGRGKAGCGRG